MVDRREAEREAARIRRRYNDELKAIGADTNLSRLGKKAAAEALYTGAHDEMTVLRRAIAEQPEARSGGMSDRIRQMAAAESPSIAANRRFRDSTAFSLPPFDMRQLTAPEVVK